MGAILINNKDKVTAMLAIEYFDTIEGVTRSCLNCKHGGSYYIHQTYWEPADYGWECKLGMDTDREYPDNLPFDEIAIAEFYASKCSAYSRKKSVMDDPLL
jgi:hypothetical protein